MERYMYNNDSFEKMLKQKADEYRMYPSGNTWDKIQQRVQKKSNLLNIKSVGLTIVLLSFFSLYLSNNQVVTTKQTVSFIYNNLNESTAASVDQAVAVNTTSAVNRTQKKLVQQLTPENAFISSKTDTEAEQLPVTVAATVEENNITSLQTETVAVVEKELAEYQIEKAQNSTFLQSLKPKPGEAAPEQRLPVLERETDVAVVPESPTLKTDAELNYEVNIPVITKPKDVRKVQYYITPSASYRVLYADNKFTFGNLQQQDPESQVTHKTAIGFEAGSAIIFPLSKRIAFRTGVQFNYTRYTVNAFKASPQLTTVRLNYTSIQRVTSLNNDYGTFSKDVSNETYQVSIPLGIELKLAGKKKLQWSMAANVQPTYLIKASGYLLTNDFKKYIKAPDLLSNLNLNTALETFIRWDAKKFQLQAGPQIRYQLFSNARDVYPIREHLIDYGFRIGIVKPLR
ncbi:MAG: hypothetical protein K2Q24_04440 [Chitinophagaceae bacterium]|jgi:hypothetical protein|nr:hypothetical protein [Chitinophagaceae bacterium]